MLADYQKFKARFPTLFPKDPECGFWLPIGWEKLVWELCKELETFISENDIKDFQTVQVKEKFNGLRFYISTSNNEIRKIIDEYESLSYKICAYCGSQKINECDCCK